MAQIIHTKMRGDHVFRKTWVSSDGRHIGVLANGGYAYLSGLLVNKRDDLIDLITDDEEREKALAWWENKDQPLDTQPKKKVVLDYKDGNFKWEDGSEILTAQSLIENLPRGKNLDMLLKWFHEKEQTKEEKAAAHREAEQTATALNLENAVKKVSKPRYGKRPGPKPRGKKK